MSTREVDGLVAVGVTWTAGEPSRTLINAYYGRETEIRNMIDTFRKDDAEIRAKLLQVRAVLRTRGF